MPADLYVPRHQTGLATLLPRLHATPEAPLPFLAGVVVRSFVLEREAGPVIVYNSPGISAAASEIARLGRPDRLLINHWHEAMYGAPQLDVPMHVHERDRARTTLPITATFSRRERIADDLELIPTPGHTSGTTMVLWDSGTHRVLFPGDAIWVQAGRWQAVVLGESDRAAYLASLALMLEIEFDMLMPWGTEAGQPAGYGVTPAEARRKLQAIIDRLASGANG